MRSSNPYPISLDLRQLRNILKIDENMDASCFNMAVRILASDGVQFARDIPVHYMDLEFCVSYFIITYYYITLHILMFFTYYFSSCHTMNETKVVMKLWMLLGGHSCLIAGLIAMSTTSHNAKW